MLLWSTHWRRISTSGANTTALKAVALLVFHLKSGLGFQVTHADSQICSESNLYSLRFAQHPLMSNQQSILKPR